MKKEEKYITIDHLDDYSPMGYTRFRTGQQLKLQKEKDNCYDDEAIVVFDNNGSKAGYVANSVSTVARGTCSAGRIYDQLEDDDSCVIRFITEDVLIAQINEKKGN